MTSLHLPTSLTEWQVRLQQTWVIVFLGLLGATPWFFWPASAVAYEVPRVFLWLAGIELLLVICCSWAFVAVSCQRSFFKLRASILLVTLVFIGIGFASSLYNGVLLASLLGNYFRIDGLLTLIHLWLLAVMIGLLWPMEARYKRLFAGVVAVSSAGVSLWTVCSAWLVWPRVASASFGNPNLLAGFLLITLPCWWFLWVTTPVVQTKARAALIAGMAVLGGALVATQSAGALAGVGLAGALVSLLRKPTYSKVFLSLCLVVVAITGFWGTAIYQGSHQFETESRYRIVRKLSLAIADKPWLGWGWSRVSTAFEAHPWPLPILHDVYVDKAHSHFLEVLTTTGVVGLSAYLFLMALHICIITQRIMVSAETREKNWLIMWLLVTLLFIYHSQTNVIGIQEEVFFWLALGISLSR